MIKPNVYLQLAPVLFGNGTLKQVGPKAKELGFKKVMIITDPGVHKVGHDQKVADELKAEGIDYVIWPNAVAECPDYSVLEGADFVHKEGADGIIGIGGGSALDTAKCVAVAATNGKDPIENALLYLTGQKKYASKPLPMILMPTNSGTGAECTFVAVITSKTYGFKVGLPSSATFDIIDPELTLGTPPAITAASGMDAFSHAAEALCEKKRTEHSKLLAYDAIRRISRWLRTACAEPNNLQAREEMAQASNFAGISFSESGVHLGHSIAHALGYHHKIPHGVACAIVTPPAIEFAAKHYPELIQGIATAMELPVPKDNIGKTVADYVRKLMKDVKMPNLDDLKVTRQNMLDLFPYVYGEPICTAFDGPITEDDVRQALTSCYDDYK